MSHPSVDPIRNPSIPSTTRHEVSEKYWSKLVTSQVYLDNPSDIVATLEAPRGMPRAARRRGATLRQPLPGAGSATDQWIWFDQELIGRGQMVRWSDGQMVFCRWYMMVLVVVFFWGWVIIE